MDHSETRERIQAAVASPGGLATLVADPSAEAITVRAHVRDCEACGAEWRAWSVMSLGLAAAAPDGLTLRPEARDRILSAVLSRPRPTPAVASSGVAMGARPDSVAASSYPGPPASRPSVVPGRRMGRTSGMTATTSRGARREPVTPRGSWFRWLALGAAAAVLVFLIGAAFGRLGLGGGETTRTGEVTRAMVLTAGILQGQGYSLAPLQTPDGTPGGFVAVSPGSGDLVVASQALTPPPAGVRYVCLLDRDGVQTKVGYMRFDGDLAYWAGPVTDPVDLGLSGDRFLVQLDTPGAEPALTGTF